MIDLKTEFLLGNDGTNSIYLNNVDSSMLDYDYVRECDDVPTLKGILKLLVTGKEGKYPHLEETVSTKILSLLPTKDRRRIISMSSSASPSEIECCKTDLESWVETFSHPQESHTETTTNYEEANEIFSSRDQSEPITKNLNKLISVRGSTKSTAVIRASQSSQSSSRVTSQHTSKKSVDVRLSKSKRISKESLSNRDYFRAWDKFDCELAERLVDDGDNKLDTNTEDNENDSEKDLNISKSSQSLKIEQRWQKSLTKQTHRTITQLDEMRQIINYDSFTTMERNFMASREKSKGNEYFRNNEYEESYACYTMSLAFDSQNAIVYSNRAMVCIRLSNLCQAISDCTQALSIDPTYTKALARRGMVHHKCGRFLEAKSDFAECVNREPSNREYAMLMTKSTEKYNEVKGEEMHEKTKKKVIVIQDDSDSEDSITDDILEEVYTPGSLRKTL